MYRDVKKQHTLKQTNKQTKITIHTQNTRKQQNPIDLYVR